MNADNSHLRQRGMTLIEVLIALALLLALGGVSLRFVAMVGQARAGAAEREARLWGGGLLMEHVERDLLTAFAGDDVAISGDGQSITITCLRFADDAPRLVIRTIRYDASTGEIVTSGGAASEQLLVSDVRWFAIRYLDGEQWVGGIEDVEGGVPRAVEVSVWFGAGAGASDERGVELLAGGVPDRPADRRRLVPVIGVVADDEEGGGRGRQSTGGGS